MTLQKLFITDIADSGAGIAWRQAAGRSVRVFVPGGLPGDVLEARLMPGPAGSHSLSARPERFLQRSPSRREKPFCPQACVCGGCPLAALSYPAQLDFKRRRLAELFRDIVPEGLIRPVLGLEPGERPVRNKALLHFAGRSEALSVGLYAPGSHRVLDQTARCPQCPAWMGETALAMARAGTELGLGAWDELRLEGALRALLMRDAGEGGRLAALVTGEKLSAQALSRIREAMRSAGVTSASVCVNSEPGNAPLRGEMTPILGDGSVRVSLCGLGFRVRPETFLQVNPLQTPRLYDLALSLAQIRPQDRVLDLYCGVGTLTLLAARQAREAFGVEIVRASVEEAERNAEANGIRSARFACGPAAGILPEIARAGFSPRIVIADPPRKGLEAGVAEAISALRPEKVVYIACGPGALARDCRRFAQLGYRVSALCPVDLFPETLHVETVCLLEPVRRAERRES